MIIKSLKLKNFRNYDFLSLKLNAETNVFIGDNAQGKTNILEALYLSGTTKSHKGNKDKEVIQFHHEEAHIETVILKNDVPFTIDMHLKKNKPKGIAINKIPIKKARELFGIVHFIFFSPEDLNIIKNGPMERRRFMDIELAQLDKLYLHTLSNYNRVLHQRNRLLRELHISDDARETLDIWDIQLVEYGIKTIRKRKQFIEQINEIISAIHLNLSGGIEELKLHYEPNIEENQLEKKILSNREKDLRFKNTTGGPHKDDICFTVNGIDIRKYGSQGQQRSVALSLKLAEIEIVKQIINDVPILLLDDVLSELDVHRQNYLLKSIHNIQTLITCTGINDFIEHNFLIHKLFYVNQGKIVKEKEM